MNKSSSDELNPEKHILRGDGRGSEENTKVKAVVPCLLRLGWDLLEDLYFEEQGADILIRRHGKPFLVVEVKAWDHPFRDAERAQLLEYALKHDTPWALFASGDRFLLFHALALVGRGKEASAPLAEAKFLDLRRGPGVLSGLLNKAADDTKLRSLAREKLGLSDDQLDAEWRRLSSDMRPRRHTPPRLTPALFDSRLERLSPEHRRACESLFDAFRTLASEFPGFVRLQWKSKSVGLHVSNPSYERSRWPGLAGLYPENPKRPRMSTAYGGWEALGFSETRYKPLQSLIWAFTKNPTPERSAEIAGLLGAMLQEASARQAAPKK